VGGRSPFSFPSLPFPYPFAPLPPLSLLAPSPALPCPSLPSRLFPLFPLEVGLGPFKSSQVVWGRPVSSPSGVWGRAPAEIEFGAF